MSSKEGMRDEGERKRGSGRRKKESKDVSKHDNMDPKVDMDDIIYEKEATVRVIKPIEFTDEGVIKTASKKEEQKDSKDNKDRKTIQPVKVIDMAEGSKDKRDKESKDDKDKKDSKDKKHKKDRHKEKKDGRDNKDSKDNRDNKDSKNHRDDKEKHHKKEDNKRIVKQPVALVAMSLGGKKNHPWESRIEGQICITANRVPGGQLQLERGKPYLIKFIGKVGSGYELIFTRDPIGGKNASLLGATTPIPIGQDRTLTLDTECPDIIYYQERNREFLGGVIYVK